MGHTLPNTKIEICPPNALHPSSVQNFLKSDKCFYAPNLRPSVKINKGVCIEVLYVNKVNASNGQA